jgi:PAS domain S-box-containing protein
VRIADLEQELAGLKAGAAAAPARHQTGVLHHKPGETGIFLAQAKSKAEDAERIANQLAAKNEELLNSMAALRLYQLMFENDPHGLVGVSAEGLIVQFNSSAIRFFGYDLHKLRMQEVSGLELPGSDVKLRLLFDQAMARGESDHVETDQENRRVCISCYRLEDIRGQRGAVFRLSEIQAG